MVIGTYAAPYVIYPEDGATNTPDGNFTLVLSSSASPIQLAIGSTTVAANLPTAPVPSPLPSPASPYPSANAAGYAVGELQPATTYTIIAPADWFGCGSRPPHQQSIATFTTK